MSAPAGYTQTFDAVAATEQNWLARRRAAAQVPADADTVGLAFSGGGIRSATFNLGVLQAFDRAGLMREVDYLSTVSGGGYIGSAYSWLRASAPAQQSVFEQALANGQGTVLDWLRAHGKYLIANPGYSAWTLAGSILAASLLNVLVLGPVIMLAVHALTLSWLPVQWPQFLAQTALGHTHAHHGYWVLLLAAIACLALFPLVAIVFALRVGNGYWYSGAAAHRLRVWMGRLLLAAAALAVLGSIPLVDHALDAMTTPLRTWIGDTARQHLSYLMPLVGGGGAVWMGRNAPQRGVLLNVGLLLAVYGVLLLAFHWGAELGLARHGAFPFIVLGSALLGVLCNINRVSMHAYYRDRIAYAYMPRAQGTPADVDPAHFDLADLTPDRGAPLHLLNTTLNTTSSPNTILAAREGECFCFSPLYVGSTSTGYIPTREYPRDSTALSTVSTISGAAVDPNTYATSSRAVSFLMALFNFRLGFWAKNPWPQAKREWPLPLWWRLIGREMLGVHLDELHRHVHLSDGGHFENLGVYELLRRRTRRIISIDAGADPALHFTDLGKLIERARVDFGATVVFDANIPDSSAVAADWFHLRGRVHYADGTQGELIYLKPRMLPGLTADLVAYHNANASFPNQSTADQFYGEAEFEAYRALGQQLTERLWGTTPPGQIATLFRTWIGAK